MTPLLQLNGLTKTFSGQAAPVVDGLTLEANAGEVLVLVGPSGCGKTTTLRMTAGFEIPDQGTISVEGQLLEGPGTRFPPERRGIGLVFQDYALFPHLTVRQNIAFGLRTLDRATQTARVETLLTQLDLGGLAERSPHDLSGGQQQRVALARALAPSPRLLLLDEPFSNLDADLRRTMRQQLRELASTLRIGILLVTHDQEEALSVGNRLAVMREGRLEQVGSPEAVYDSPASLWVAEFLGGTNLLKGEARGNVADTSLGPLALRTPLQGPCQVSIRPEQVVLTPPGGERPVGIVGQREFLGHASRFHLQLDDRELISLTPGPSRWTSGDAVGLQIDGTVMGFPVAGHQD